VAVVDLKFRFDLASVTLEREEPVATRYPGLKKCWSD
jgi:hypothetical protein